MRVMRLGPVCGTTGSCAGVVEGAAVRYNSSLDEDVGEGEGEDEGEGEGEDEGEGEGEGEDEDEGEGEGEDEDESSDDKWGKGEPGVREREVRWWILNCPPDHRDPGW